MCTISKREMPWNEYRLFSLDDGSISYKDLGWIIALGKVESLETLATLKIVRTKKQCELSFLKVVRRENETRKGHLPEFRYDWARWKGNQVWSTGIGRVRKIQRRAFQTAIRRRRRGVEGMEVVIHFNKKLPTEREGHCTTKECPLYCAASIIRPAFERICLDLVAQCSVGNHKGCGTFSILTST